MGKNITIVGGGSSSFVPLLLRRLIRSPSRWATRTSR